MYERLIARDISPTQAINQELQVSCSSLGKVEFELSNFGVECIQRRLQWILEMDIGQDFIYRLTFFSVYHICVCLSMPVPRTEVVVLATVMAASTEKQPVEDRNLDRSGKSWTTRFFLRPKANKVCREQTAGARRVYTKAHQCEIRSGFTANLFPLSVPTIQPVIIPL